METANHDLIEEYHSEDIMSVNHSKLIHRLCVALNRYEDQYDILPELELELSTVKCKPDISIYNHLMVDWLNDVIFYSKPPITAVEILSPRQALTELTDKAYKQYFPAGVLSVWLIIPVLQNAYILFPDGSKQVFTKGQLIDSVTGIELDLDLLFR
ncbi:Uma2 family endonuclease [Arundinibacter roseus]|uniref:Uma2 family endonuclease n=1 Tax=Arundinibacter roseus TaxID=2070510 RepID=A0A4R4K973_9BACT|nr:Uma2 family endonuclease [Arundinibacter roseus]TDB62739.1 Uma2 family endonuclease [Arundinibacter roseus]